MEHRESKDGKIPPRDRRVGRLRALRPSRGEVAFAHLGQMGYLVRIGRAVVGCDLFLSPLKGRLVPPQLAPEDVADVDFFIGSHDHADHIDRPLWRVLARLGTKARFLVPAAVRASVLEDTGLPSAQVVGMDDGDVRMVAGVRVTALASAHERLERDALGRHLALGFVLEGGGARIYHSGDCCLYDGLQKRLASFGRLTAAFLPINGRDAWRLTHGFIGNMDAHEVVELAGELDAGTLVPGHHDMFAPNLGDMKECVAFARAKYPALRVLPPRTGHVQRICGTIKEN